MMQDGLRKLPEFIAWSRKTSAIFWQNIVFAIGVKFVCFALTFTGHTSFWLAVFANIELRT
ncbi:MAG: hypothetical protein ABL962_12095 [Fimbriimonadaceae bacterium]